MELIPSIPNGATYAFWILRIVLGVVFFAHGAQKVLGWFGGYGLKGTGDFFAGTLNVPRPLFYLAAFTEFLGGILMVLGIFPRLVALGFVATMLVAIVKVHWKSGFFLSGAPGKSNGYEFNLALIAMSLAVAIGL